MTLPQLLEYAAVAPRGSIPYRAWRAICFTVVLVIFIAVVIVRAALLALGFACVFAGTLLLYLGGRRSAGVTLQQWRSRFADLLHLWMTDMVRPFRRTPVRVLSR